MRSDDGDDISLQSVFHAQEEMASHNSDKMRMFLIWL